MTAKTLLIVSVMITLGLAGCVGGSDGEGQSADADPEPTGEIVVGEAQSLLRVLVTDDALQPLADVTVAVQEVEVQQLTNADGIADFKGLEPGKYTVIAQKLGFDSSGQSVELPFEGSAEVAFTLDPVKAAMEAYHETLILPGAVACGIGLVVTTVTWGACGDAHDVTQDVTVTPDIETIIMEMTWEKTTTLSASKFLVNTGIDETCNPCSFEKQYGSVEGPSPLYGRLDASFAGITDNEEIDEKDVRHRVWVPYSDPDAYTVVLVLNQRYDMFSSQFYGQPAPEGFSARPDA